VQSKIGYSPFAQALNLKRLEQGQEAGEQRVHQALPEPQPATALIAEKAGRQQMTLCQSSSPGGKAKLTLDNPKASTYNVVSCVTNITVSHQHRANLSV